MKTVFILIFSIASSMIISVGALWYSVNIDGEPFTRYEYMSLWALWAIFYCVLFTRKGE